MNLVFRLIVRVAMMIRNGAWAKFRAHKLMPVLGSSAIRYRRAVKPFQAFDVTCRVLGWDEKWLYLEHRILLGDDVAAVAVMKAAFLSPSGRVATQRLLDLAGYTGAAPPLPAAARNLAILDESRQI
jgi:acyl-CoA thioesterase FadM